ncbi:MAG: electron transport complex subunit RsxC [Fusobacteriaceae bacterium]
MNIFGFKGGIHPKDNKNQTENKTTERISMPNMLYIPMLQHIGTPLDPIVQVGEKVLKGQKIAESSAFLVAPIHAPTSGTVKKIDSYHFPLMGKVKTIFLEPDGEELWCELEKIENWKKSEKEDLLNHIKDKGIVGLGGASFPTHIKLNPPSEAQVDTLLINAAECEPYLNSDNRTILEKSSEILEGIEILRKILGVKNIVIGIEDNKKIAIQKLKEIFNGTDIKIAVVKTLYPQGGEKQLIKSVLNREVPSGKLPLNVGVVVQNIATAAAVYEAVVNGIPLIEKIITVSGGAVKNPKNIVALIGTQIGELLNATEADREKIDRLVVGGPMMGMAQYTDDVPVVKGTSGVLGLTKEETNRCKPRPCIGCGKCVDACPMGLPPVMYARLGEFGYWEQMKTHNLMDCIECGCCTFICPSNRPLAESIKLGKVKIRSMMNK